MRKPKALIFDVFGTICDWRSGIATEVKLAFDAKSIDFDPHQFADLWRGQYQPAMEKIRSGNRGYIPLDTLHRENLDVVLDETGLGDLFDIQERKALNHAWEKLPAWPEVSNALQNLRKHTLIAPCSNGSIALMVRLARFAALPWDTILGADMAQNYKPEPEVYLASCSTLGLMPEEVMMVACHNSDLVAARDAGLMTGFFPRPHEHGPNQTIDLEAESDWDFIGADASDLLQLFA